MGLEEREDDVVDERGDVIRICRAEEDSVTCEGEEETGHGDRYVAGDLAAKRSRFEDAAFQVIDASAHHSVDAFELSLTGLSDDSAKYR